MNSHAKAAAPDRGPTLAKCVKIQRDHLCDVARQFSFGTASVYDLEKAASDLIEARENYLDAEYGDE